MLNRKKSIHVTLALPTFVQSEKILLAGFQSHYPKILKTTQRSQGPLLEAMLFNLIARSPIKKPPFAAISAIGSNLNPHEGIWLRADPVELLVDAGNICLVGRDHLFLENNETEQLLQSINHLLQEDQLFIQAGAAHEWFFNLNRCPDITTSPFYEAIAKDIRKFLPTGSSQGWWRKLLTELQMLLFQHKVNDDRQNAGKPIVNGVWIWGEGQADKKYDLKPYDAVWSNHSLIKGMIILGKQSLPLLSEDQFQIENLNYPGDYLVTLDYHHLGKEMTTAIVMKLLQKIQSREIHQFNLCLGNGDILRWQASKRFFNL